MASRYQLIYMRWREDIQDIIGPAAQWPNKGRRLFWTRGLIHFQRIWICTFSSVNGLKSTSFLGIGRAYELRTGRSGMDTLPLPI